MAVHRELDTLLKSCSKCVQTSQILRREFSESIRVTRDAVHASRALIAQSDAAIERVRTLTTSSPHSSVLQQQQVQVQEKEQHQGELEVVSECSFENQRVLLDGKHFVNCTLNNCTLEYSGHPVVLETTAFHDCNFQFRGEAALTMQLLECFELVTPGAKSGYSTQPSEPLRREQLN